MRYNKDVINAENWNTGLKKSELSANPDLDEDSPTQADRVSSGKKLIKKSPLPPRNQVVPTFSNICEARNRIRKRKKRGMFLLSGLLTGLASRTRNHK